MGAEGTLTESCDVFVIGGGINGCGIARDAAGRGLTVTLVERGDFASATSSASTKLFHGGLRYLEYFEFRLVQEALAEREVLLKAMPHISRPMRFVLPYHRDQKVDTNTPASRLINTLMPWTRGRRPAWLIRMGLFLYDNLGGREILPGSRTLDLRKAPEGQALKSGFDTAFEYSDCWIDDARLVVLNARDAAVRGAEMLTHTRFVDAVAVDGAWVVTLEDALTGMRWTQHAKVLVNAAGPWVADILRKQLRVATQDSVRLVRGSHIVVRKLFDHDKAYFFQGRDGRIAFAIPYETDFTLVGTTDVEHSNADTQPVCTDAERDYLLDLASEYFDQEIAQGDVVWTYSGVRPLYDNGAMSASAASRDYVLKVDQSRGAPVLSVFGGKITTYRKLAEAALERITPFLAVERGRWTAGAPLPGGDFHVDGVPGLIAELRARYPFLSKDWAGRLVRSYGTDAADVLGSAQSTADLGYDFGATLTECEVHWLMTREFAQTAEDVLWRRTKLGLRFSKAQTDVLSAWMANANAVQHVAE